MQGTTNFDNDYSIHNWLDIEIELECATLEAHHLWDLQGMPLNLYF